MYIKIIVNRYLYDGIECVVIVFYVDLKEIEIIYASMYLSEKSSLKLTDMIRDIVHDVQGMPSPKCSGYASRYSPGKIAFFFQSEVA